MMRLLVLIVIVAVLLAFAGRFLVVNEPQAADAIVVLAGDTKVRPARGLELLRQHQAAQLLLDVPAAAVLYDRKQTEIAEDYLQRLPESAMMIVCPVAGLSTAAEADDAARCLSSTSAKKVLLVTSDYHTRRALLTFRKRLPKYEVKVAAAYDPAEFGVEWWQHRQWAKRTFDEWLRLIWWEAVDQWR